MNDQSVDWKETLILLTKYPSLHARFLNSLSLVEYIGARKIIKSQNETALTAQVLSHVNEEIRHAQIFKQLVLRMSKGELTSYSEEHTLCKNLATSYIQNVDQDVANLLNHSNSWFNYLATTLLVEERANEVYPIYEDILSQIGFKGFLKKIVLEEKSHLEDIKELLKDQKGFSVDDWKYLKCQESQYFSNFIQGILREVDAYRKAY